MPNTIRKKTSQDNPTLETYCIIVYIYRKNNIKSTISIH